MMMTLLYTYVGCSVCTSACAGVCGGVRVCMCVCIHVCEVVVIVLGENRKSSSSSWSITMNINDMGNC